MSDAQRTLADFKAPYSAEIVDHEIFGRTLLLRLNGRRFGVFSIDQRGEQGAIDAAWEAAYGSGTPSEIDTLRELNAELLAALKEAQEVVDVAEKLTSSIKDDQWVWGVQETIRAAIAKAEGRT